MSDTNPHFRCSNCGTLYKKAWSDESAAAELLENFPDEVANGDLMAIVCHDCYERLTQGTTQKLIPFGHGSD